MRNHTETVEIRGHIIDSLILPKILDEVVEAGADFEVLEFQIGKGHQDPSFARIQVWTADPPSLERLLKQLQRHGAQPVETQDAGLIAADIDGTFPDGFYSTTNLPTEVRVGGRWIPVTNTEMDCGLLVESESARTIPMADVRKGQMIVTGHAGIKVTPLEKPRGRRAFEFMGSAVSSEKPKKLLVDRVADQMRRVRDEGAKILWVVGPAVIHTGSGPDLARLTEQGWVDILFAGNGFAAHDIESNLFGTSLGVYLHEGTSAEAGHEHHLRAINTIRRVGSISTAVEKGVLTGGVMFQLAKMGLPFVLGGSVRDDGPLPDTITDVLETQGRMREVIDGVGMAVVVASMLHGIATGNILPATVSLVCVDIDPSTVTKLLDRGSTQSLGVVTDVGLFVKRLADVLLG